MAVLKRLAARTQPCRTPDEMVNGSVRLPFTGAIFFVEVYSIVMMSMMFCGVPNERMNVLFSETYKAHM